MSKIQKTKEDQVMMQGAVCPTPLPQDKKITMGHGSGGRLTHDLIRKAFLPPFDNPALAAGDDAGIVRIGEGMELAISTDSHVVAPLFFPGGNIGRLAVCGTVNDVAMMGAKPLYLTAGFILEEGLDYGILEEVVMAMRNAAKEAGVAIIAGDTKVVERGKVDRMFISTTGVGVREAGTDIGGANAKPGDVVILSGSIGDHGIAVLSARGELGFEAEIESDVSPLNHLVAAMLEASEGIRVLRDPTRGGLATSLNEIANQSGVQIVIEEEKIPVRPAVQSACEMLGFDPLYIANEGKLIAIVEGEEADKVLGAMKATRYGEKARIIGEVRKAESGRVLVKNAIGSHRVLDMLSGEMLPRIC